MSCHPAGYSSNEDDDEYDDYCGNEANTHRENQKEITSTDLVIDNINNLYFALVHNNVDLMKEILDSGVDVNCIVSEDYTPLFLATFQGSSEIVEELLKRNADVKATRDGFTSLMAACSSNNSSSIKILSLVELFVKYGVDVQAIDRKRKTALMLAASQGFTEVVNYLLPLSNLEAEDNQGWTALFYAVDANKPEIVKILLDAGADVLHVDCRSNNLRYYACLNDHQNIMTLLPKEEKELNFNLFINNDNIEKLFENLQDGERPKFANDVFLMLYGMKCEKVAPVFSSKNIDLTTFLNMDDEQLQNIGVSLSFFRARILQGLHNFHKQPWKKHSIPSVTKENDYISHDTFMVIANAVKHISVMEASLKYLELNVHPDNLTISRELIDSRISMILNKIERIKTVAKLLYIQAKAHDKLLERSADLITKDFHFKKNILNRTIFIGITGISVVFVCCYLKCRFR